MVLEVLHWLLNERGISVPFEIAVSDKAIEHGDRMQLYEKYGLDPDGLVKEC